MTDTPLSPRDMLRVLRGIVQRAWQTAVSLPDPDRRYRGWRSGWLLPTVADAWHGYGASRPRLPRHSPSPQDVTEMHTVMGWMAWLRRTEGERAVQRIAAWALGVPAWRIADREGCSDRTVQNRIDRSLAAILRQYGRVEADVEEEGCQGSGKRVTAFTERPEAIPGASCVEGSCVWIDGLGWMRNGRPWDDGTWRARRYGRAA